MNEKVQNLIGGMVLVIIIILIISIWLTLGNTNSNTVDNTNILTLLDVNADPAAYTGDEIRVEGVVISKNNADATFLMMPSDIYIQCDRNAYCGEEYSHLKVSYTEDILPSFEHKVVVTGIIKKIADNTYVFDASIVKDKGKL
jgi:hypothetical protein